MTVTKVTPCFISETPSETVKSLAARLGFNETRTIHFALTKLAREVLPSDEPDDGALSKKRNSDNSPTGPARPSVQSHQKPVLSHEFVRWMTQILTRLWSRRFMGSVKKTARLNSSEFLISRQNKAACDLAGLSCDTKFDLKNILKAIGAAHEAANRESSCVED
jgi:hypothetical protein